ncbi:MAG: transcription elongation factor GreA [Chloroflexota bacterium]|nr:transcription elongation factor GreA [Chloroflexota bacterium]MBI5701900.1 transcription elongation factor GreA [Chloroflexota bacterium]
MTQTTHYLTSEGEAKLRAELAELTGPRREELAKRLRSAIQMGDLSENADYHKAKEDQAFLEGRIQEIEAILRMATIIENTQSDVVAVGSKVTIQEENFDPETFYLVGASEADPRNGKISNESPFGKALLNHKVGDVVEAQTPSGKIKLKILKIE